jgi:hypothetical protein
MSVDAAVLDAIEPVVTRAAQSIGAMIAKMMAAQVEAEVRDRVQATQRRRGAGSKRRARAEITRWTADRRARRVPTFVIEMTGGLDTKKKIVAKFGDNAVFEKGKPLPPVADKSSAAEAKPEVKARGPIVRKKGKAAA